jgi:anaerobic dimethyl sulfoxide reductase subunit A
VSLSGLPRGPFQPARSVKAENWAAALLEGQLDPPVRLAYIVATNAINRSSNTRANARALGQLDFVVVNEPFRTPTALHADVVLPVCTDLERADLVHRGDLWLNRGVVPPRGQSRTDYWVFARLAERLGFGAAYTEGKTEEEWLEQLLDASGSVGDALRRQGAVRADGEPRVPLADFRADPAAHPLATPSGRIEILCPQAKDHGLPDLPAYVEQPPADARHPLQLVTPHYRFRANSCEHANAWLRRLEPHAVWIHPSDARARGVEHGDPVEVLNELGTVALPAKVTERILPGVVCIYQGAWYRPAADGVDEGGCANVLTSHHLSPTGGMATHSERVDVRKREA